MKSALCYWQLHILHKIKLNAGNVSVKTAPQLDQRNKLSSMGRCSPVHFLCLLLYFPPASMSHPKAKQSLSLPTSLWTEWLDGITESTEQCTKRVYQKAQRRCVGSSFSGLGIVKRLELHVWNVHYCHPWKETNIQLHVKSVLLYITGFMHV